jgi:hypothetical protein
MYFELDREQPMLDLGTRYKLVQKGMAFYDPYGTTERKSPFRIVCKTFCVAGRLFTIRTGQRSEKVLSELYVRPSVSREGFLRSVWDNGAKKSFPKLSVSREINHVGDKSQGKRGTFCSV